MESYDVKCPICGKINYQLYLKETDGWMECEQCHTVVKPIFSNTPIGKKVPVYTPEQLVSRFCTSN